MSTGPADVVLDTFKTLVWDLWVKALIAYVLGLAPWLAFGPVSFIVTRAITWITDRLYVFVRDGINLNLIMLNNELHHSAYISASRDLQIVFDSKGIDSKEFKDAREKHKKSLSDFVRYSGT